MSEPSASIASDPDASVVVAREGRIGRILLNRPKALNALDHAMIVAMTDALVAWRDDPLVHAVVLEGAGDRAFCAGGDIRAIRMHALAGGARGDRAVLRRRIRAERADRRIPEAVCMR